MQDMPEHDLLNQFPSAAECSGHETLALRPPQDAAPAPEPAALTERAVMPTLLGSPVRSSAGVQVWSADRRQFRPWRWLELGVAGLWSLPAVVDIVGMLLRPGFRPGWFFPLSLLWLAHFTVFLMATLKPTRIAVDDHGMAVITWRGTRALTWDEVHELHELGRDPRWPLTGQHCLRVRGSQPIVISLRAFDKPTRDEITGAIVRHAHLVRTRKGRYQKALPGGGYLNAVLPGPASL